jgi:hypothetical protein
MDVQCRPNINQLVSVIDIKNINILLLQLRSVMEKAGMYNVDLKCSQDGDE